MMKTGEISNDVGSVLCGKDAVKYGLIDEVGGIKDALAYLENQVKNIKSDTPV